VHGEAVAQLGQLAPEVAVARKLREAVFLAEIDVETLYRQGVRQVWFEPLGKYPAVERDFSFIFADAVTFAEIENAVDKLKLSQLGEFGPAEIFRGGSIEAGKYSILLRAKFESRERTLREDEVAEWSGRVTAALAGLGGVQR
jgi:phenylalanyl-tRNA synthetase beta chain